MEIINIQVQHIGIRLSDYVKIRGGIIFVNKNLSFEYENNPAPNFIHNNILNTVYHHVIIP